jgi:drug/metabolite transporter (DMT)-like permease
MAPYCDNPNLPAPAHDQADPHHRTAPPAPGPNGAARIDSGNSDEDGRSQLIGVLLVLGSALAFSLAGVLTKMVESDAWTVVCWRGLFSILPIVLYAVWREKVRPLDAIRDLGWKGWTLATVGSLASAAFIAAFKLTYVANVVVIYATVPFVAAGLAWLALRERVKTSTLLAAGGAFLGVMIMVSGGIGTGHLTGDLLAALMTIGMAAYMVLIRVFRETPVVLAIAASSLQLFIAGWFMSDPLAVSAGDLLILALFGFTFALAAILLTEGTRLIPAAEAGLLGTAETPLAPLLAWLVLAELPPNASLIGGSIVLAVVLAHAARDFAEAASRRRSAPP